MPSQSRRVSLEEQGDAVSSIHLENIEKYQKIFSRDPHSKVFAPLAEAYREMGMLKEAEQVARQGVQKHPDYVSGLVALGRVLLEMKIPSEAQVFLEKATRLTPENILAYQLLAQAYLENKQAKLALKNFKMVLFLNPQHALAQRAVEKLESLTADEYEEELFQMQALHQDILSQSKPPPAQEPTQENLFFTATPLQPLQQNASSLRQQKISGRALERYLSLIDAFLVRNNLEKAKSTYLEAEAQFADHPQLQQRKRLLFPEEDPQDEVIPSVQMSSRSNLAREKKLKLLQKLLHRFQSLPA